MPFEKVCALAVLKTTPYSVLSRLFQIYGRPRLLKAELLRFFLLLLFEQRFFVPVPDTVSYPTFLSVKRFCWLTITADYLVILCVYFACTQLQTF